MSDNGKKLNFKKAALIGLGTTGIIGMGFIADAAFTLWNAVESAQLPLVSLHNMPDLLAQHMWNAYTLDAVSNVMHIGAFAVGATTAIGALSIAMDKNNRQQIGNWVGSLRGRNDKTLEIGG